MSKQELINRIKRDVKKLKSEYNIYIEDIGSLKYFCDLKYTPEDDEFVVDTLD